MAVLPDEKQAKPSIWNQALKVVKGDSANELVEEFTREMTLVAEGLCEDQARLRKAVDALLKEAEGQRSRSEQDAQELQRQLDASREDFSRRLDELSRRVAQLEKADSRRKTGRYALGSDVISRLTVLAAIVCGTWLLVTVLQLLM